MLRKDVAYIDAHDVFPRKSTMSKWCDDMFREIYMNDTPEYPRTVLTLQLLPTVSGLCKENFSANDQKYVKHYNKRAAWLAKHNMLVNISQ